MFDLRTRRMWLFENDGGGGSGGGNDNDDSKNVTMTQEQLDKLFGERAEQAKNATTASMLKDLGVTTLDELKAALKKGRELETASLTEQQKLQKAVEDAQSKAVASEQARLDAEERANNLLLRSEVTAQAVAANFVDPSDAWALIDASKLSIDEDGKVKGAKEAVEALAKAKPHLVKGNGSNLGTPRRGEKKVTGAGGGSGTEDDRPLVVL